MEYNICVKGYTIWTLCGFESLDSWERWGKKIETLRQFEARNVVNFCHRNVGNFCQTAPEASGRMNKWPLCWASKNVSQSSCCINGRATNESVALSQIGKLSLQLLAWEPSHLG